MTINRRLFMAQSTAALAVPSIGLPARAQSYPTKPVTILVGFTAGGPVDIAARAIADALARKWGQPVIVDVRPGANGTAAAALLAKAPADGYTLLMGTRSMTMNAALYTKLPYNPATAFTPIAIGGQQPTVLVVSKQSGIRNLADLIKRAKADPDKLSYASTGNGSIPHLAAALFQKLTDTKLVHVPYKGGSALIVDLMTGRVDMSFATLATVYGQIQTQQLVPIAVADNKRAAAVPDLPTFEESGVRDFEVATWYGLIATSATPAHLISQINADVNQALATPELRTKLNNAGMAVSIVSPQEYKRLYDSDIERYGKLIRGLGLSLD